MFGATDGVMQAVIERVKVGRVLDWRMSANPSLSLVQSGRAFGSLSSADLAESWPSALVAPLWQLCSCLGNGQAATEAEFLEGGDGNR